MGNIRIPQAEITDLWHSRQVLEAFATACELKPLASPVPSAS
jgi:hypothetical protein